MTTPGGHAPQTSWPIGLWCEPPDPGHHLPPSLSIPRVKHGAGSGPVATSRPIFPVPVASTPDTSVVVPQPHPFTTAPAMAPSPSSPTATPTPISLAAQLIHHQFYPTPMRVSPWSRFSVQSTLVLKGSRVIDCGANLSAIRIAAGWWRAQGDICSSAGSRRAQPTGADGSGGEGFCSACDPGSYSAQDRPGLIGAPGKPSSGHVATHGVPDHAALCRGWAGGGAERSDPSPSASQRGRPGRGPSHRPGRQPGSRGTRPLHCACRPTGWRGWGRWWHCPTRRPPQTE